MVPHLRCQPFDDLKAKLMPNGLDDINKTWQPFNTAPDLCFGYDCLLVLKPEILSGNNSDSNYHLNTTISIDFQSIENIKLTYCLLLLQHYVTG